MIFVALAITGISAVSFAQAPAEKPTTSPPAAAAQPAVPAIDSNRPKSAEYQRIFEDWKATITELRRLKVQYQSAPEADQANIQQQWKELVAKGEKTVADLEKAGLEAYAEAPNEDPQLTRFLVKLADDRVQHDEFAAAKEIAKVLIENQCPEKQIYDIAGAAAYCTNDFVKAEEYFKLAKDAGVLSTFSRELEPTVKEHQDLWTKEQAVREAEAKADDLPRVKLTTTKGEVVIELFENEAPQTVGNFVYLVEKGFYDGLTFHRVLKNFMAQGGDPKGDGKGGPGYEIYCEWDKPEYRRHFQGSLSMAHAGRDTGGSQFFLTFRPTPHLNSRHTCFGRVIEGMEVLPKLQKRDPDSPTAAEPDKIVKAEVVRKRNHEYVPRKVGEAAAGDAKAKTDAAKPKVEDAKSKTDDSKAKP
jgi:cyclophilin family peptidyl-prolyl cis-trans isomerase